MLWGNVEELIMFWIVIEFSVYVFFVEKRVCFYENMWFVLGIGDMVYKNKIYGDDEEGFDFLLKFDMV